MIAVLGECTKGFLQALLSVWVGRYYRGAEGYGVRAVGLSIGSTSSGL